MKRGFTLPEVLAAVLVFAIGILGLASSGSFIAIQAGEARALTEGVALIGRVVDSLRSVPCATVASGQRTGGTRTTVRWTATPAPRSVTIAATLELSGRQGGNRPWHLTSLVPC